MAVDLVSEGTGSRSEERVLGSQWPRVPISTMTSSEENPLESRLLRACWYISLFSFLVLALYRQSGGGEQDSSIRAISSDFTMTISGRQWW